MSFDANSGRRGRPLQDLTSKMPGSPGAWRADVAGELARMIRRRFGLIGSGYARHMAEALPRLAAPSALRDTALTPDRRGDVGGARRSALASRPEDAQAQARDRGGRANSASTGARSDQSSEAAQLAALKAYLSDPEVEGFRDHVYLDSRKIPTTGVGHRVRPEDNLRLGQKVDAKRLDQFFQEDAAFALKAARAQAAEAGIDDPAFITALGSVNFQLGDRWNRGKNGHKKTWALIRQGDYAAAADEVARSNWNRQTPKRVAAFQKALRALPPKSAAAR